MCFLYAFGAAQACSSGVREKISKIKTLLLVEASTLIAKCRKGTSRRQSTVYQVGLTQMMQFDAICMRGDKKRRHLKNKNVFCLLPATCLSQIFRNPFAKVEITA